MQPERKGNSSHHYIRYPHRTSERSYQQLCLALFMLVDDLGTRFCVQEKLAHLVDVLELNLFPASQRRQDRCGREQLQGIPVRTVSA